MLYPLSYRRLTSILPHHTPTLTTPAPPSIIKYMPPPTPPSDPDPTDLDPTQAFRHILQHQANGNTDHALQQAHQLLEDYPDDPSRHRTHAWLGQTLITRKRQFADGLHQLQLAIQHNEQQTPPDPYTHYTAGWCHEFIANALDAGSGRTGKGGPHQPVTETADQLYTTATQLLLRAYHLLEANPDDSLQGDVEDMLSAIANHTGVPWDNNEDIKRAPPRTR